MLLLLHIQCVEKQQGMLCCVSVVVQPRLTNIDGDQQQVGCCIRMVLTHVVSLEANWDSWVC